MTELRLMLLVAGIIVIAGVYVLGRRSGTHGRRNDNTNSNSINNTANNTNDSGADSQATAPIQKTETASPATVNIFSAGNARQYSEDTNPDPDDADLDDIDNFDIEWLEEIAENVNYDELMYRLSLVQGQSHSVATDLTGHGYPAKAGKVFVSTVQADNEKTGRALLVNNNVQPLVLVMHIISQRSQLMRGDVIASALKSAGLVPGEMQLFHLYEKPRKPGVVTHRQRIFSVANLAESGKFDPDHMADLKTPGITLIMQLPGPVEGLFAFERFYNMARRLSGKLGGTLYDAEKNPVTVQTINQMKQSVADLDISLQLGQRTQIH